MESSLSPALDNTFMCRFENRWPQDCHNDFKTVSYRQYVDGIFEPFFSSSSSRKKIMSKEYL